MAQSQEVKRKLDKYNLKGVNKPKRTPSHPSKSHIVLASQGGKTKLVRFGQAGVKGAGNKPKTEKEKARRKSFRARHDCANAKNKLSAAYWSCKEKW